MTVAFSRETVVGVAGARGFTAYDATYVALAESLDGVLVTDDKRLLDTAGTLARPLGG
jgi:predicted nucleic acid-binding protein